MTRAAAILESERYFDEAVFLADLAGGVRSRPRARTRRGGAELRAYLEDEMRPGLERQGFRCTLLANSRGQGRAVPAGRAHRGRGADHRIELRPRRRDPRQEEQWRAGLNPWVLTREGDRLYGRGKRR